MKKEVIIVILCIAALAMCSIPSLIGTGLIGRPSVPTVSGPEATHLLSATKGHVIYDVPVGGISGTSLPSLKTIIIRNQDKRNEPVYALSGPDENGFFVFLEKDVGVKHILNLSSIQSDKHEVIFTRPVGSGGDYGEHLALSRIGGHVAFVGYLSFKQMYEPKAYIGMGQLEIWDIFRKNNLDTQIVAINNSLAWFPGGKKLVYSKFINRKEVPTQDSGDKILLRFGKWIEVPAVFVYNIKDGTESFLHVGWSPKVATDGKSIIIADFERNYYLVELSTKKTMPVILPGGIGKIIAFTSPNTILYLGAPTAGVSPEWTKSNSPLVGPKAMLSLKLLDLSTGDFQTVKNSIDPRRSISYGNTNN